MLNQMAGVFPNPYADLENFAAYQTTHKFYQELRHRQDFYNYCQWYQQTAERHQQELQQMRREINLFSWFRRQHPNVREFD